MVIKEVTIKEFNGGIAKDLRLKKRNKFGLAKNFDVFTYKHKIEPNLDLEDRTEASYSIVKFLASPITLGGVSNPILGFAKDGGFCAVYHWNGSIWDVEITNDTSSAGTRNENAFFYYKNSVLMFGGSKLKRFDADGTDAFDEDYVSTLGGVAITAFSNVAQPVHHLRDDIAYFFTDYFVHKLDDATWTTDVLELPSGLKITSACSFGNYLAIACADDKTKDQKSYIYLWERNGSLATVDEMIELGSGEVKYIANLNNKLFAVIFDKSNKDYKIIVKQISGEFAIPVDEIISDTTTGLDFLHQTSQVTNNKLYFPAGATKDGNTRYGVWELNDSGKLNLFISTSGITDIRGIFNDGNRWWISHDTAGGTGGQVSVTVSKVNPIYIDAEYETLIIGKGIKNNKLIRVGVSTEALSTDDEVVVEYKKNEDLSGDTWVEIFTEDVNDSMYHEAINTESDGKTLPEFREMQLKITSKNGAIITGVQIEYEEIDDGLT